MTASLFAAFVSYRARPLTVQDSVSLASRGCDDPTRKFCPYSYLNLLYSPYIDKQVKLGSH